MLGAIGGFLVVPMNALLQHRGHNLMGAGRSIAVQNFNEQACILGLGAFYTGMTKLRPVGVRRDRGVRPGGGRHDGAGSAAGTARNSVRHRDEVERLLAIARSDKPDVSRP